MHTLGSARRQTTSGEVDMSLHPDSRARMYETPKYDKKKVLRLQALVKGMQVGSTR